jgi:RNA polymerase sigma-70 factor (ECF subfamily)
LLGSDYRNVLVLKEVEEMDYQTISEILDIPIGTVRSRLHRARQELRWILEQWEARQSPNVQGVHGQN